MKKIIHINATEALNQDSLVALKGGTKESSPFTGGTSGKTVSLDGGDETDKRPKRPTVGSSNVMNVAKY
jgi:hypothetical protein